MEKSGVLQRGKAEERWKGGEGDAVWCARETEKQDFLIHALMRISGEYANPSACS